jgi:hypothetical protein
LERKNAVASREREWLCLTACMTHTNTGTIGMKRHIQIGSANLIRAGMSRNWIAADTALMEE